MIAFDIGIGTQDILIDDVPCENSPKLVLPSPVRIYKNKVESCDGDLFIDGYTMGGGPLSHAIVDHAESNEVVITERAARTISDDLEEVSDRGIKIVDEDYEVGDGFDKISLTDLGSFQNVKNLFEEKYVDFPEKVACAVQDHGVAPIDVSDRKYRFNYFKKAIESEKGFNKLIYTSKTNRFSRINSVIDFLKEKGFKPLVVDSKIASLIGCLGENNRLIIDAGNGHFLAASCRGNELIGLFEHHSSQLNKEKIRYYLKKLKDGTLKNREVFNDGGHGAFVKEELDPEETVVTGPRRNMVPNDIGYRNAHPIGDVMMTGAFGLFRARKYSQGKGV